jgi:signal transduction histidine kinase
MFQSARLKLTGWYLLIIMLVTGLFSIAFYDLSTMEINRISRRLQFRQEFDTGFFFEQIQPRPLPNLQVLEESKERLKLVLILINGGILVLAGGAGYFLAGRTLRPIQHMVDEQNRFITDASHELRTPLTALRSEMEATLLDKHIEATQTKKLIASNLEEVIHLQSLSDNLLQLVQYQNNTNHPMLKNVSLLQSMEDALKKITPLAKRKSITIKNTVDDRNILALPTNLTQLWIILLENAVKYSPKKSTVSISSSQLDYSVEICIEDNGIGIDPKDIPFIFDRFYRADKSRTKTDADGYGLGLSIAKNIVQALNGTIQVKSTKDKGTTFTVLLPIADRP